MSNDKISSKYDLEERTQKFGEDIIEFAKKIPKNAVTLPLIGQLAKAGISVGANYMEANGADSKKDFIHKIGISKREAKETKHWLRMAVKAERILESLFEAFTNEPNILPDNFQEALEQDGLEKTVCYYIAGMTDRFAIDEYQKLFDPTILP